MARILISEPREDVRRLLARMVLRLGHEPIAPVAPSPEQLRGADLFLIEPAAPIGAVLAQAAHLIDPAMALICASVEPPSRELLDLGVHFDAVLIKPFTLAQLGAVIEWATCRRPGPGSYGGPGPGSYGGPGPDSWGRPGSDSCGGSPRDRAA